MLKINNLVWHLIQLCLNGHHWLPAWYHQMAKGDKPLCFFDNVYWVMLARRHVILWANLCKQVISRGKVEMLQEVEITQNTRLTRWWAGHESKSPNEKARSRKPKIQNTRANLNAWCDDIRTGGKNGKGKKQSYQHEENYKTKQETPNKITKPRHHCQRDKNVR